MKRWIQKKNFFANKNLYLINIFSHFKCRQARRKKERQTKRTCWFVYYLHYILLCSLLCQSSYFECGIKILVLFWINVARAFILKDFDVILVSLKPSPFPSKILRKSHYKYKKLYRKQVTLKVFTLQSIWQSSKKCSRQRRD